ncbi:MAG: site-specific integrase [Steroidobacteraceae bacterium]|nr:site-specific integrase [Steroidobacteraceae bacterium]
MLRGYTVGKKLEQLPEVAAAVIRDCEQEGLSAATTNRYLAALRRVANLALRWGWTDKAIGRRIELLPGERSRHVYLTVAQVNALAKAAGGEMGDLIRFAALTGLRRSEILRLTPESLVDGAVLLDANTKSGRPRGVPLPPQALRIAKRRLPFTLGVSLINKRFRDARVAAKMPTVRFHDLRHTYASWLVRQGAQMTSVRDLLGHSSLAVTSRYSHIQREDLVRATARLRV